jgi:hypothetical protein
MRQQPDKSKRTNGATDETRRSLVRASALLPIIATVAPQKVVANSSINCDPENEADNGSCAASINPDV